MSTQLKAAKLVSALLGEEGPDDYLNQLGIVRQSQTSQPKPEAKPIDIKPGSLASNILKGKALDDDSDMDADDLLELWATKRLRRRGLRADRDSVEALLNDLGSSVDEYIEYNEEIYGRIIEQITEEIEHSKKDPDGWWALIKSVVDDEDADGVED
jgi:hypothetical protein